MPHQCIECGRTFPDGSKEMLSGCPDCGGNKFQFQPSGQASEASARSTETTEKRPKRIDSNRRTAERSDGETGHRTAPDPTPKSQPDADPGAADTVPTTSPNPESTDSGPESADPRVASSDSTDGVPDSTDGVPDSTDGVPDSTDDVPDSTDDVPDSNDASGTTGPTSDDDSDSQRVDDGETENAAQASARTDVVSRDEIDRASRASPSTESDDPDHSETTRPDVDQLRSELNEQFESIRIVSPGQYELNLMELYDRQEYIISVQEDGRYVIEMPDAWGVED